jgi:hypothetical protein
MWLSYSLVLSVISSTTIDHHAGELQRRMLIADLQLGDVLKKL